MPGLIGVFDQECAPGELYRLLKRMCNCITHESWYQIHTYVRPPIASGRVGLGITNPQPQPAVNEDELVLVWLDGEIYDFQRQTLTRQLEIHGHKISGEGDAELIAHLYEEMGEDCFSHLDGTFAVAIYDSHLEKMIIAVDRDASRPLYYYCNNGRFLFSCELKAILEDDSVPRLVDEQGVIEFFSFRHVLGDRTLLKDVHFLQAGHLATHRHGLTQVRSYWKPTVVEDRKTRAYEAYVDEIIAALQLALERQIYDKIPIGEFLSGGLDSRLLAGLVPNLNSNFHTFSRGPKECWDVQFGARVAECVGSQHHFLELKPDFLLNMGRKGIWITDGLMTVNDIYVLATIEQVKSYVDLVFLGIGRCSGIIGGIEVSRSLLEVKTVDEAAKIFFAHNGNFVPQKIQKRVFSKQFQQEIHGVAFNSLLHKLARFDSQTPLGVVEAFCMQCRWPRSSNWGAILSRTQVETRFPYSDNELSDLVCKVPARWRLGRQMQLAAIKRSRSDLARVPWEYTGLPADMSSPKAVLIKRAYFRARREIENLTRGLVPSVTGRQRANYALWYRTVLRPWLEEVLLDEQTLSRGYYDREGIRQLINEHMSNRYDRSLQFGLLLTFELWSRLFIDGEPL